MEFLKGVLSKRDTSRQRNERVQKVDAEQLAIA